MKMRSGFQLSWAMVVLVLSGCAVNTRDHVDFYEDAHTKNKPVVSPVRSVSNFDDALSCMDKLLGESGRGTTLVGSKAIPDASGKVFVGTKDMVTTALQNMSRTSNAFKFVDSDSKSVTSNNPLDGVMDVGLSKGVMNLQLPDIYVTGSISFMDQNVLNDRRGVGVSGSFFDFGTSRDKNASVFGMDLHLGEFTTRTLIQGVSSANEIVVANAGKGIDAGGRINKTGVQFNFGAEVSQGVGPAVRSLVDLGMIELIGKWAQLPYWQCLALDSNHPEYQGQMREWWDKMKPEQRFRLFRDGLHKQGYAVNANQTELVVIKKAAMIFQADHKLVATGELNFETYAHLMKNRVRFDENGKLTQVGWVATQQPTPIYGQIAISIPPRNKNQGLVNAPWQSPGVKLSVKLNSDSRVYTVGEQLQWTINTDRHAYVYCYYEDSKGVVSQVYPNSFQNLQPVAGNKAMVLPDPSLKKNFLVTVSRPGVETLVCAASPNQIADQFPPELRAKPLLPMSGIQSIADIARALEPLRAAGAAVQTLRWTVLNNN